MERRGVLLAYGAPTLLVLLVLVGLPFSFVLRATPWGVLLLAVATISAPLWPLVALRIDRIESDRPDLLTALDFQLTMVAGYLLGALLILIFVGVVLVLCVLIAQCVFGANAAWRARRGEAIGEPRVIIRFSDRLGLA